MNVVSLRSTMLNPLLPPLAPAPIIARIVDGEAGPWQPADWLTRALQSAIEADGDPLRAAGMLWRLWRPATTVARRALALALQEQRSPEPLAALRAWLRADVPAAHFAAAEERIHTLAHALEQGLQAPDDILSLIALREHLADLSAALHLAGRPSSVDLPRLDAAAAAKTLDAKGDVIDLSPDWNDRLWQVSIGQPDAWWCAFRLVD